ncbi:hypothetical protein [Ferrovibrio sp.]|uniref:hypothetical protein n=1 Tax=Ferrovibrio sp. TaxID=1917215 RepID=UPI001B3F24B8|nr:hypothetical protein [Ferrovibrio sp.]MBP7065549.1 hypothetical protein [Ferrovibrio sp.]
MWSEHKTKLIAAALLIFSFALVIADFWGVRFTTNDDARIANWAVNNGHTALGLARGQGRIYFFYHFPIILFIAGFWQSVIYDILQYGSYLLALVGVVAVLAVYTSWRYALFFALVYVATLVGTWDHTLMTSVPLYHFVVIINMAVNLLLLAAYRRDGRIIWLLLFFPLHALSIFGQEYQVIIASGISIISLFSRHENWQGVAQWSRRRWHLAAAIIVVGLAYTAAAIAWRMTYGNSYDGAEVTVGGFNLRQFIGVLLHWSVSGNVLYHWLHPYSVWMVLSDATQGYKISFALPAILSTLTGWDLLKAAALGGAGYLTFTIASERRLSGLGVLAMLVVAGIIMYAPTFLLALTPKYQGWYGQGVIAYTYTSLSNVGFMLAIAVLFGAVEQRLGILPLRWIARACFVFGLAAAAITGAHHNHIVARAMKEGGARWAALDMTMKTPIKEELRGSLVIGTRMSDYYWAIPGREDYWKDFITGTYKLDLEFRRRMDPNLISDQKRSLFYFDYAYLPDADESVAIVNRANYENGRLYSSDTRLLSKRPLVAALNYTTRDGGQHRILLASRPFERVNGLYLYPLGNIQADVGTIRVDEQVMWAPPKILEGEVYRLGTELRFGEEGRGRLYMAGGWSGVEKQHTWAIGPQSGLRFLAAQSSSCDLKVTMSAWGFYVADKMPRPLLTISVNGKPLWAEEVTTEREISFMIPRREWRAGQWVDMRFDHAFARVPRDLGASPDTRALAIGLRSLKIQGCEATGESIGLSNGYEFGELINFAIGGNAQAYQQSGWGTPEVQHTWMLGSESLMQLPLSKRPACDLRLKLRAVPFYVEGKMPYPRLEVVANGETIGNARIQGDQELVLPLSRAIVERRSTLELQFLHPDFKTPQEVLGSTDTRPLSVGVKSLQLEQVCP